MQNVCYYHSRRLEEGLDVQGLSLEIYFGLLKFTTRFGTKLLYAKFHFLIAFPFFSVFFLSFSIFRPSTTSNLSFNPRIEKSKPISLVPLVQRTMFSLLIIHGLMTVSLTPDSRIFFKMVNHFSRQPHHQMAGYAHMKTLSLMKASSVHHQMARDDVPKD